MTSSASITGQMSIRKTVFEWDISAPWRGMSLLSPEFDGVNNERYQLEMTVEQCFYDELLCLYLKFLTPTICTKIVTYILHDEEKIISKASLNSCKIEKLSVSQRVSLLCKDQLSSLNHKLKVIVEIETDSIDCYETKVNLDGLFNSECFSDVKFVVEGKSLHAHKNILANTSHVFAAMFKHQMKENIENTVEIKDINQDVFLEMLRFIYTGTIRNMKKVVKDLLVAADKYDLIDLKALCAGCMCNSLSVNNAFEYLNFARHYHVYKLEKYSTDFILSSAKSMVDLPGFDGITELDSEILLKIIRGLILKDQ